MNRQLQALVRLLRSEGFTTAEPRSPERCVLANADHIVSIDIGGENLCRVVCVALKTLPLAWVDCRTIIALYEAPRLPFWDVLAAMQEAHGLAALAKSSLAGSGATIFQNVTVSSWMKVYVFQSRQISRATPSVPTVDGSENSCRLRSAAS